MTNHKKSARRLGILCPNATTEELLQIVLEKFKPEKAIGRSFTRAFFRDKTANYGEETLWEYYLMAVNDAARISRRGRGEPAYLFSLEQVKDLLQIEPDAIVIYDRNNDCFVVPPTRKEEARRNARVPAFA